MIRLSLLFSFVLASSAHAEFAPADYEPGDDVADYDNVFSDNEEHLVPEEWYVDTEGALDDQDLYLAIDDAADEDLALDEDLYDGEWDDAEDIVCDYTATTASDPTASRWSPTVAPPYSSHHFNRFWCERYPFYMAPSTIEQRRYERCVTQKRAQYGGALEQCYRDLFAGRRTSCLSVKQARDARVEADCGHLRPSTR